MSLSHFDEASGIVSCKTPWGQWWQTIGEVFIEIDVPEGTRAKDCKIDINTKHIKCLVGSDIIFEGDLHQKVIVDDCTWTIEEETKISILLTKCEKFTNKNLWESLLSDDYAPDPWTKEQMLKKLDLEKMQIENVDERSSSPQQKEEDAESNASRSDNEAEIDEEEEADNEQVEEQTEDRDSVASSPPQSPTGSVNEEQSEDEVHISEAEGSNHGSDIERENDESEGEMSTAEVDEDVKKEEDEEETKMEEDEEASRSAHNSDREEEEDEQVPEINIQSEDEDNAEKVDSDAEEKVHDEQSEDEKEQDERVDEEEENGPQSPKGSTHSDDENENDESEDKAVEGTSLKIDSDAEGSEDEEKGDNVVADIFGDDSEDEDGSPRKNKRVRQVLSDSEGEKSDAEDDVAVKENDSEAEPEAKDAEVDEEKPEEAETSSQKEVEAPKQDEDSEDDDDDNKMRSDFISDFELMMKKKKEENSRKRKRKDVDIINDSDDLIADIIAQMRVAADEDRQLNKIKKTATKKLRILPHVMSQLKKQDLKMAFLDQGVLNVMADWLAPLPDRSLPNLQIREGMIKRLMEFPYIDQSLLKSSGVGRALMYLYKHPKETKENKERAGKLITEWARPIFNVTTDYHSLTKEEREQRDFYQIPKKRRMKGQVDTDEVPEQKDIDKALREGDRKLRPGDKGWIGRARVPMPSTKDYVVRPKWNVEMECGRAPMKKPLSRFEKHMRSLQEKKRSAKSLRAVTISIEGRKMAI